MVKLATIAAVVFAGTLALAAVVGARTPVVNPDRMCAGTDARVVVDLQRHILALCEKDNPVAVFDVRLGRGGIGKTREGDRKTPVGTYGLGEPRPSNRFGTFIPIEYPTEAQKKLGYTGSAVGIHGPPRWAKWLGSLVNSFDLSDGCVGVARDSEIEKIATWVKASSAHTVELR